MPWSEARRKKFRKIMASKAKAKNGSVSLDLIPDPPKKVRRHSEVVITHNPSAAKLQLVHELLGTIVRILS